VGSTATIRFEGVRQFVAEIRKGDGDGADASNHPSEFEIDRSVELDWTRQHVHLT
jgi:hypothetical protein